MKVPKACVKLCQKKYSAKEMKLFRQLINEEYRVHWYVVAVFGQPAEATPRHLLHPGAGSQRGCGIALVSNE